MESIIVSRARTPRSSMHGLDMITGRSSQEDKKKEQYQPQPPGDPILFAAHSTLPRTIRSCPESFVTHAVLFKMMRGWNPVEVAAVMATDPYRSCKHRVLSLDLRHLSKVGYCPPERAITAPSWAQRLAVRPRIYGCPSHHPPA
jgi:hypothetical protein